LKVIANALSAGFRLMPRPPACPCYQELHLDEQSENFRPVTLPLLPSGAIHCVSDTVCIKLAGPARKRLPEVPKG
jgi:hypothetical protein